MKNKFQKLMRTSLLVSSVSAAALLFHSPKAEAYFSTMDTGDLVAPGEYRVGLEPQVVFNKYDGLNLIGRFDTGVREDSSVEAILGVGKVNFQTGAFYKWIPFPDLDSQPAIGGKAGFIIARVDDATEVSLRFHPIISKRFETGIGVVSPYGSIPFGLTSRKDTTEFPVQLAGGADWQPKQLRNFHFMAELGLNIAKSVSYISLGAIYDFDEIKLRGRDESGDVKQQVK